MTIPEWLFMTEKTLQKTSETARLDADVLLSDALGKTKAWLLAHPETTLQEEAMLKLDRQVLRRSHHEPLAYIRGKQEFYGRDFIVTNRVLVPRPESETMIDLLKSHVYSRQFIVNSSEHTNNQQSAVNGKLIIIDVGTGSGALGITASLELGRPDTILIDVDRACLEVARVNTSRHNVKAKILQGDLLEPLNGKQSTINNQQIVILANLPYVPNGHAINNAAKCEPKLALFGGVDGLDLYRRFFAQLTQISLDNVTGLLIFTESLPFQHKALEDIADRSGFSMSKEQDLIQVFHR